MLSIFWLVGLSPLLSGAGSVQFRITNTQSTATPLQFQQMVTFNPSSYASNETPDLGNVRFYSSNVFTSSNELYSWCESGCNSTSSSAAFWVLIPSGIPANGNVTIIMDTLQVGTQYDGVYAGEAPQLSTPYAKYDNGAKVFPALYQDFAGTSIPAGWNAYNATINNGASLQTSGTNVYLLTSKSYGPNASAVLDIDANFKGVATITNMMAGYIDAGGIDTTCWGWSDASHSGTGVYDFESTSCTQATSTVGTLSSTNATYHIYSITNPYPSNLALSYDYGVPDTSLKGFSNNSQVGIYAFTGSPIYLQWIRFRARPPNGVMPTVSIVASSGAGGGTSGISSSTTTISQSSTNQSTTQTTSSSTTTSSTPTISISTTSTVAALPPTKPSLLILDAVTNSSGAGVDFISNTRNYCIDDESAWGVGAGPDNWGDVYNGDATCNYTSINQNELENLDFNFMFGTADNNTGYLSDVSLSCEVDSPFMYPPITPPKPDTFISLSALQGTFTTGYLTYFWMGAHGEPNPYLGLGNASGTYTFPLGKSQNLLFNNEKINLASIPCYNVSGGAANIVATDNPIVYIWMGSGANRSNVTFTEQGLPWGVANFIVTYSGNTKLNRTSAGGHPTSLNFSSPSGPASYDIPNVTFDGLKYIPNISKGNAGAGDVVNVKFKPTANVLIITSGSNLGSAPSSYYSTIAQYQQALGQQGLSSLYVSLDSHNFTALTGQPFPDLSNWHSVQQAILDLEYVTGNTTQYLVILGDGSVIPMPTIQTNLAANPFSAEFGGASNLVPSDYPYSLKSRQVAGRVIVGRIPGFNSSAIASFLQEDLAYRQSSHSNLNFLISVIIDDQTINFVADANKISEKLDQVACISDNRCLPSPPDCLLTSCNGSQTLSSLMQSSGVEFFLCHGSGQQCGNYLATTQTISSIQTESNTGKSIPIPNLADNPLIFSIACYATSLILPTFLGSPASSALSVTTLSKGASILIGTTADNYDPEGTNELLQIYLKAEGGTETVGQAFGAVQTSDLTSANPIVSFVAQETQLYGDPTLEIN